MSIWQAESRSIEPIPHQARHGSARDLFTLWFSANMQVTTVVVGTSYFFLGLPLVFSIIAILLGNLIGAVFMAYHSAQGPILGLPQMVQSRAQFGFYGAIVPLVLVAVLYLGFFALSAALGGEAIHGLTSLPMTPSIALLGAITALMAVFGYDLIHAYQRYVSPVFLVAFVLLTIAVAASGRVPHGAWSLSGFRWGSFCLGLTISATWQITYAPYVSDYSRYLPKDIGVAKAFNPTYWGTVVASTWMMVLGALLMEIDHQSAVPDLILRLSGRLGGAMLIVLLLGILAANLLNAYGGMLTTDTLWGTFAKAGTGVARRIAMIAFVTVAGTLLGVATEGDLVGELTNFIVFLAYFAVPWTAVNLTDFYLVRHGQYEQPAFFRPAGYGRMNPAALAAYALGVVAEIPFINSILFEGPLARALGGADISWIVGLAVSGGICLAAARKNAASPRAAGGKVPAAAVRKSASPL